MDDISNQIQVHGHLIDVFDTEIDVSMIVAYRSYWPNLEVLLRHGRPIVIPDMSREKFRMAYLKAKENYHQTYPGNFGRTHNEGE